MAGFQVDGLDSAISQRETQNDMRWMGAGLEEGLRLANPSVGGCVASGVNGVETPRFRGAKRRQVGATAARTGCWTELVPGSIAAWQSQRQRCAHCP